MKTITVVSAVGAPLARAGLARVLRARAGIALTAEYPDLRTLLRSIDEDAPDAIVVDVRMPPAVADEATLAASTLRVTHPSTGVVLLAQRADVASATRLFADGSAGRAYVLAEGFGETEDVVTAVVAVADGGTFIDPAVVEALIQDRTRRLSLTLLGLTEPERAVLDAITEGRSNSAVARALFLSERTVEKHINSLFSKLGLGAEPDTNRRVMAVLIRLGVVDPWRRTDAEEGQELTRGGAFS